jgi:hypothetical protein
MDKMGERTKGSHRKCIDSDKAKGGDDEDFVEHFE